MALSEQLQRVKVSAVQAYDQHAPTQRQLVGLGTVLVAGFVIVLVSLVIIAVTALVVSFLAPVILVFSPVLIPLLAILALGASGVLLFSGFGVAFVSTFSWIYQYAKGSQPLGSDQLDAARTRIVDTASHVKDRALDVSNNVQEYLHKRTSGSAASGV